MRDEWIAVARGLKCLSISLKWNAIAIGMFTFYLLISLVLFFYRWWITLPYCQLALIPCAIALVVAFLFSRSARILAMQSPREIPNGRFFAISSLVLEIIGQTGLTSLAALYYLKVVLDDAYKFFGGFVFLTVWLAGKAQFQQLVYSLANAVKRPELADPQTGIWFPSILGVAMVGTGIFFNSSMGIQPPCCVLLIGFPGLILLWLARGRYSAMASCLRFSVLREAVRCERGRAEPD